jgi:hypothetical protein
VEERSRRLGRQDKADGYLCLCGGEGGVGSRRRKRTCQPGREEMGGVLSHGDCECCEGERQGSRGAASKQVIKSKV